MFRVRNMQVILIAHGSMVFFFTWKCWFINTHEKPITITDVYSLVILTENPHNITVKVIVESLFLWLFASTNIGLCHPPDFLHPIFTFLSLFPWGLLLIQAMSSSLGQPLHLLVPAALTLFPSLYKALMALLTMSFTFYFCCINEYKMLT
jgi:hypothetical protein